MTNRRGRPPSAKTLALNIARDASAPARTRWEAIVTLESIISADAIGILVRELLADTKHGRVVRLCLQKLASLQAQMRRQVDGDQLEKSKALLPPGSMASKRPRIGPIDDQAKWELLGYGDDPVENSADVRRMDKQTLDKQQEATVTVSEVKTDAVEEVTEPLCTPLDTPSVTPLDTPKTLTSKIDEALAKDQPSASELLNLLGDLRREPLGQYPPSRWSWEKPILMGIDASLRRKFWFMIGDKLKKFAPDAYRHWDSLTVHYPDGRVEAPPPIQRDAPPANTTPKSASRLRELLGGAASNEAELAEYLALETIRQLNIGPDEEDKLRERLRGFVIARNSDNSQERKIAFHKFRTESGQVVSLSPWERDYLQELHVRGLNAIKACKKHNAERCSCWQFVRDEVHVLQDREAGSPLALAVTSIWTAIEKSAREYRAPKPNPIGEAVTLLTEAAQNLAPEWVGRKKR